MNTSNLLFVQYTYLISAIPCFVIIGVMFLIFEKTTLSRGKKVALFSITGALIFTPVMLPTASITILPGPSLYAFANLFSSHGPAYAGWHLAHYPIFTILSPAITLMLGIAVALKIFPDKLPEPNP